MSTPLIVHITADGSPTLYHADIDEHYHSTFGAISESRHIFINEGLRHRAEKSDIRPIRIFEVGFGTGLNAVLSAMTGIRIDYTTIEKFPVNQDLLSNIPRYTSIDVELFNKIHEAPWEVSVTISPTFNLHKIHGDITNICLTDKFDVLYLDAFSPEKQPELWDASMLAFYASLLDSGGVLTTYCSKGVVRRALQQAGLITERLPGPAGGKREILRATKP